MNESSENVGIATGPGGISGGDPTRLKARNATASNKKADKTPDINQTWEQRVLRLLTTLQAEKVFKDLKPDLKEAVRELIEDAPDDARS